MIKSILIGFAVFLTLFIATCISASCKARIKSTTVTEVEKKDSSVLELARSYIEKKLPFLGTH
jgi:hypothetical protein